MNTRWYESFFSGIVLDMWSEAAPPEWTKLEADFLARSLELAPGAAVLDVPCGLGRHTLELASRGFRVTGVDLSEEALARACRTAGAASLDVTWRQANMRDLPWEAAFDAAFCFGNSFAYMEPENNRQFLKSVSRALKPGGRFAMDTGCAAESILPRMREKESAQFGDIKFEETNRYLVAESCIETTYTFTRGDDVTIRTGLQWVYTVREIRGLLAEAGLTVRSMHGSADGSEYAVGSLLIVVAQKEQLSRNQ